MAILTANVDNLKVSNPGMSAADVYTATTIYYGSWVCYNATGYAIPAADTAGNLPAGLASDQVVNSGSSGAKLVPLWTAGEVVATFDAITQADVGKICYVLDSGALSIYNAVNNISMAVLRKYISATKGRVEIIAGAVGGSTESAAVDDIELYKVDANKNLTAGSILMKDDAVGDVMHGADTASMRAVGVSIEAANNTGGASGDISVATRIRGKQICVAVGADDTWIGKSAHVTAANTVALTSTNEVYFGTIRNVISATSVVVEYNLARIPEVDVIHPTDKILFSSTAQKGKTLIVAEQAVTGTHDLDLSATFSAVDFVLVSLKGDAALGVTNGVVIAEPGAVAGHVDISSQMVTTQDDCTLIDSSNVITVTLVVIGDAA